MYYLLFMSMYVLTVYEHVYTYNLYVYVYEHVSMYILTVYQHVYTYCL